MSEAEYLVAWGAEASDACVGTCTPQRCVCAVRCHCGDCRWCSAIDADPYQWFWEDPAIEWADEVRLASVGSA